MPPTSPPPAGRVLRPLKDGYWDITEVIELPGGMRCVRKRSKPSAASAGPWGRISLRREIGFLRNLPPTAARHFPPVLAWWDQPPDATGDAGNVGYDMPFYDHHRDAGSLAAAVEGALAQDEIDEFQQQLSLAVFTDLHQPAAVPSPLSQHFDETVREALAGVAEESELRALLQAEQFRLDGEPMAGPVRAWEQVRQHPLLMPRLDATPAVRLHGDLFLENILWRPADSPADDDSPRLLLIDPVSVAGISAGPPLFDLVKYVSYASGELIALRSEWVKVGSVDPKRPCTCRIDDEAPGLVPFRRRNWYRVFRDAFEERHGTIDQAMYHLIDGYFSAAMALNTRGLQRRARLLKATREFHRALQETDRPAP